MTAADNAEWLERFKVDAGISTNGPGLPDVDGWNVKQGGLGLAPPYAFPKGGPPTTKAGGTRMAGSGAGGTPFAGSPKAADRYVSSISQRYPLPAKVFCARELEEGLIELVKHKAQCGGFPTDEELKERGRVILGLQRTSAEVPALLEKFKKMMETELGVTWEQMPSSSSEAVSSGLGDGAGVGAAMNSLDGSFMGVGEGLCADGGFGGIEEMPGLEGMDMGMDLPGDVDSALMQDLNFDFVFDTQDAMMGEGSS